MTDFFGLMGTALYSRLSGGTALLNRLGGTFVYSDQAPENQDLPYVVFSHQGGGDDNDNPHEAKTNLWSVRAYSDTRADANAIDGEIEALLHKRALTVLGWTNIWIVRETDISLVENPPNSKPVYMAGAFYRIRIVQ